MSYAPRFFRLYTGPEYGVVGSPDGLFNNYNTLVRSSSLDRTIMTARWVLMGLPHLRFLGLGAMGCSALPCSCTCGRHGGPVLGGICKAAAQRSVARLLQR